MKRICSIFAHLVVLAGVTFGAVRCSGGAGTVGGQLDEFGPGPGPITEGNNGVTGGTGEAFTGDEYFSLKLGGMFPKFFGSVTRTSLIPAIESQNLFPQLGNGDFTLTFLLRPNRQEDLGQTSNLLIAKSGNSPTYPFRCEIFNSKTLNSGKIACSRAAQGERVQKLMSTGRLDDGNLHLIVFSLRQDELFLFIDGYFQIVRLPTGASRDASNSSRIHVAGLASEMRYLGEMLQTEVYDQSFTNSEIFDYYSRISGQFGLISPVGN